MRRRDRLAEPPQDRLADRPAPPEQDLERGPTDPATEPDAASLLVAEIFQRRGRNEQPSADDGEDRVSRAGPRAGRPGAAPGSHPHDGRRKRIHDRLLRLVAEGEELFGFRLRHQLGRGAFASVYLAEQRDLACRPVVLKISATEGTEHQTLARLQHTNIVPIFSVHEDPAAGLRAVCMPYFGGATLASILERLWDRAGTTDPGRATGRGPRGGRLAGTAGAGSEQPADGRASAPRTHEPPPETQTPLTLWRGLSYYKAVAWIAAQLAEGLHHAHQRGILHRDIKPSNILLSAEGQPLLLDFNVAQEMTAGHRPTPSSAGRWPTRPPSTSPPSCTAPRT